MKQIMTLFLAGAFMAAVPAIAFEENALDSQQNEITAQEQQEMFFPPHDGRGGPERGWPGRGGGDRRGPEPRPGDGRHGGGHYRGCPPGTERRPEYRWDARYRRWVMVGWTCGRRVLDTDEVAQ
jgi:hypothetical protein